MPTGFTTITAAKIQNASGVKMASGRVTFFPVSSVNGAPVSATAYGGGPISQTGTTFLVVNGAITTDLYGNAAQVADTSLTTPVNIAYRITITDASGVEVQGPGYGLQQPTGTTWSLDTAIPNQPLQVIVQTGPAGPPLNFRGTWSSAITYALGDAVAYGGSNYISLVAGNINHEPDTSGSDWAPFSVIGSAGAPGAAGPVGPTGPPANFAGVWASGTTYTAGQAVSYTTNGNSYVSLIDSNAGNEPDTSPASWGLLATAVALTPSSIAAQIASANSSILPALVAYTSGTTSTTTTIGASSVSGDQAFTQALGLLPTLLPVGSILESITMQLGSPGTVDVVIVTIAPVASNNPTSAPSAVLDRFTLDTADATTLSAGVYRWTAVSGFTPYVVTLADTAIGILSDGTAQILFSATTGPGIYVSTDNSIPLTGGLYLWNTGAELDMAVVVREFAAPVTLAEVEATISTSIAADIAGVDAAVAVPLAYATLGSTVANFGATDIAVNQTTGNVEFLPYTLPLGAYIETITIHLDSAGTIDVLLASTPSALGTSPILATVYDRFTLDTADAVEISPNIYQWTGSIGYPMLQTSQANTCIGLAPDPYQPVIQRIAAGGTGVGYFEAGGGISGEGTSDNIYWYPGGQLDFAISTRTLVALATEAQLTAAIAALSGTGGATAVKGRVSSCLISNAGAPYSGSADFIVSATGAEAGINPIIASFCEANQNGCRIYLDIGFSTTGPIVIDGDNVELSGMNHAMWGGYDHAWENTSSPVGAIGSNANITATDSAYSIIEMGYAHMQGTDTTRHRGTCIHDLYLVGNNYTSTGIQIAQMDDNVTIRDMVIQRCAVAMNLNLDSPTIYHNSLQDVVQGIQISGVFPRITENLIFDIGGIGINVTAANAIVRGNIIGDCNGGGLLSTAPNLIVEGNQFATNNGVALQLNQYSDNAVVSGNIFDCNNSLYGLNGIFPNGYDRLQVNNCAGVVVTANIFKNQANANTGYAVSMNSVTASGVFNNIFRGTFTNGPVNIGSNANANNITG